MCDRSDLLSKNTYLIVRGWCTRLNFMKVTQLLVRNLGAIFMEELAKVGRADGSKTNQLGM